jgi:hypothetical protein
MPRTRSILTLGLLGGGVAAAALTPWTAKAQDSGKPTTAAVTSLDASVFRVIDLEGRVHVIGSGREPRATAFVFLSTDCPISNRAIATLDELSRARAKDGVLVLGVLSDPALSRAKAVEFAKQYKVEFPVVLDTTGDLARRLAPTHTPEAFVVAQEGTLSYRGRIDDAYADLGKPNARLAHHDLDDAVAATLAGKPPAEARTAPVGCAFEAWNVKRPPETVTFARHVAPILYAHCAECHHPGAIGPFPLVTYADAAKRARTIASVTESRYMPPWHVTPGFGHFADERRLSAREIEVLNEWARGQAPPGDPAEQPPAPVFSSSWALGEPDFVVAMPQDYEIPASGPDIYRAFVLDKKIPEDSYVVATDFKPGSSSVVHHCIVYLDAGGVARQLEKQAGGNGYPAFGGPHFLPAGSLGGWAPGATPGFLPEGFGRRVAKDQDIVVQMHYHPSGKVERDRSSLAVYLAKKPVEKIVDWIPLWNDNIDILPHEKSYLRHAAVTLPVDVTVIGAVPHMHLIGREMKVEATTPEGEKIPLVWVQDWDFRWQGQYNYATPFRLKKGTRITLEARYDNSPANPQNPNDPPQEVLFGEQTTDEMCLCFVGVATDRPEDMRLVERALRREKPEPARPPRKHYY